jgi:hypothetical protein
LIFKLFSKGDQLKVKLAKLKFSEIGDGRLFLAFGGRLVIGRGDYVVQSRFSLLASFFLEHGKVYKGQR